MYLIFGHNDYRDYRTFSRGRYSTYFSFPSYLEHHGIKGQKKGVRHGPPYPLTRSSKIDTVPSTKTVGNSGSQKKRKEDWTKYEIRDPVTKKNYHLVEPIKNPKTFAGFGTKHPLKPEVKEGMTKEFPGSVEDKWAHRKGEGVIDYHGDERRAEVHWFQEEHVGKQHFKIKEWLED